MTGRTYTVEQAARVVGVHPLTLRQAINRGEFPAVRVGRRVLVPISELEAFLDVGPGGYVGRHRAS